MYIAEKEGKSPLISFCRFGLNL